MTLRWPVGAALLVLAGLFGMHGLGDHGMSDARAMSGSSTMSGSHARSAGPMESMGAAPSATVASDPVAGPEDGHGSMAGMAAMCLAVLAGFVLALLVLRRALRRTPWILPRRLVDAVPVARGRSPDPPSLSQLCVLRC